VDGYDPGGSRVHLYAVPAIVGAIKCASGTVPGGSGARQIRSCPSASRQRRRLTQRLGRSPTIGEIADQLGVADRDVSVALQARQGYRPDSLDSPPAGRGDDRQSVIDTLGAADTRFDAVTDRTALRPLLAALPERQRRILSMRFFDDMSQAEIAVRVGLSQMQISRLLVRTLAELRAGMLADDAPSGSCR
jgi:RNA polymerase sigma-B factor